MISSVVPRRQTSCPLSFGSFRSFCFKERDMQRSSKTAAWSMYSDDFEVCSLQNISLSLTFRNPKYIESRGIRTIIFQYHVSHRWNSALAPVFCHPICSHQHLSTMYQVVPPEDRRKAPKRHLIHFRQSALNGLHASFYSELIAILSVRMLCRCRVRAYSRGYWP